MSDKVSVPLEDFAEMQQLMFARLKSHADYGTDNEYTMAVNFLFQASADSISTILKMATALGDNGVMGKPGDGFILKEKIRDYKGTN